MKKIKNVKKVFCILFASMETLWQLEEFGWPPLGSWTKMSCQLGLVKVGHGRRMNRAWQVNG